MLKDKNPIELKQYLLNNYNADISEPHKKTYDRDDIDSAKLLGLDEEAKEE